jgi:hypothetical protein
LWDTDGKTYESNQKNILMIVKGDILHKVRLKEKYNNMRSDSIWEMIKQLVKRSKNCR